MESFLNAVADFIGTTQTSLLLRWLFMAELYLAEILFMIPYRKRRGRFALRLSLSSAVYFLFGLFFPERLGAFSYGAYITYAIFAVSLAVQLFSSAFSLRKVAFNCAGAYALQSLCTNVSGCIRVLSGISGSWRYLIDLACVAVLYTAGYFLFAVRSQKDEDVNISRVFMLFLTLAVLFLVDFMSKQMRAQGLGNNIVCLVSLSCSNVLVLLLQYSSFSAGKLKEENEYMEIVLAAEQEQYRQSCESIELVNVKHHDLAHKLAELRSGTDGGTTAEVLSDMEDAVRAYAAVAKTGNDALDSVLTQKSMVCRGRGIQFSYIVDGAEMGFMRAADIWSLLCNGLDNAIECECGVEDPEKRIIFLNIGRRERMLTVHLENYCEKKISFESGLPQTDKADRENHGIGVRSIRYIAQKYGGHSVFAAVGDFFCMDVMIPIRETAPGAAVV